MNSKHSVFGHYYFNQSERESPNIYPKWISSVGSTRQQNVGINWTWVISPTLLNQVTLGYTRAYDPVTVSDTLTNAQLGLEGMPDYIPSGANVFSVSGRWSLTHATAQKFVTNNYDINEGLTWIKGAHTMKFGFQYLDLGFFQTWYPKPSFNFNGTRTGDAMADFMTGAYRSLPIAFGQRLNDGLSSYTVGYAQDDWKISSRLTLNFGLRYELPKPWVDKGDRINTLDITSRSAIEGCSERSAEDAVRRRSAARAVCNRQEQLRSPAWLCLGRIRQRQVRGARSVGPVL